MGAVNRTRVLLAAALLLAAANFAAAVVAGSWRLVAVSVALLFAILLGAYVAVLAHALGDLTF